MAAAVKRVVARLDPTYVKGRASILAEEANMPDSASRSLPFAGQPAVIEIAAVVGVPGESRGSPKGDESRVEAGAEAKASSGC